MGKYLSDPSSANDRLFNYDYTHAAGELTCDQCDDSEEIQRPERPDLKPVVHYGSIASVSRYDRLEVMNNVAYLKHLCATVDMLCLDVEAFGLPDGFPRVVIRGISDYADTHHSKLWEPYAATVAAAYTKELLLTIPPRRVVPEAQQLHLNISLAPNTTEISAPPALIGEGQDHAVNFPQIGNSYEVLPAEETYFLGQGAFGFVQRFRRLSDQKVSSFLIRSCSISNIPETEIRI